MSKLSEALKEAIESVPNEPGDWDGEVRDVGVLLESAMMDSGYELQCHQRGINGTRVLAVRQPK